MTGHHTVGRDPQVRLFDENDPTAGWSWTVTIDRGVARVTLPELVRAAPDDTAADWLFTEHIDLLDAYMVTLAQDHGPLFNGPATTGKARRVTRTAHKTLIRLAIEWALAARDTGRTVRITDANILGTAMSFAHRARRACDDLGDRPTPDGMLDGLPADGIVSGTPELVAVDPYRPGLGAIWTIRTNDGLVLPTGLREVTSPLVDGTDPDDLVAAHLNALRALLADDDPDRWAAWAMTIDLFWGVNDPAKGDIGFDAVRLPVDDPGAETIDIIVRTLAHDIAADRDLLTPTPKR